MLGQALVRYLRGLAVDSNGEPIISAVNLQDKTSLYRGTSWEKVYTFPNETYSTLLGVDGNDKLHALSKDTGNLGFTYTEPNSVFPSYQRAETPDKRKFLRRSVPS